MTAMLKSTVHEVVQRVRGEYREMPGLSPTLAQAQRLFGLDDATCRAVLDRLVRARLLSRNRDGRYIRLDLAS
jgi:DNA-binding IclR family transcriptional regulator